MTPDLAQTLSAPSYPAVTAFLAAYGLGLSLIVAIGAQNAFFLRQGLRREHVGALVAVCGISDAVLIVAGVAGFGTLAQAFPWFETAMRYGGALFLLAYGAMALRNAWRGGQSLKDDGQEGLTKKQAVLICLALTWGNPHVYLDTLALMGAVSAPYAEKVAFAFGGSLASISFFIALGYGARYLRPIFATPMAWRLLDVVIGCVMWAIALSLVL
jgi:L-lysine exporter family protein LysE/ArgO